jgi:hypothetical protein
VTEVLSLASDGLKVLQIDTIRYQEKIERLETQVKQEMRRRLAVEDQLNVSRGNNSIYELSRSDQNLKDESVMSIISSNTQIKEELQKLSSKLNMIV